MRVDTTSLPFRPNSFAQSQIALRLSAWSIQKRLPVLSHLRNKRIGAMNSEENFLKRTHTKQPDLQAEEMAPYRAGPTSVWFGYLVR